MIKTMRIAAARNPETMVIVMSIRVVRPTFNKALVPLPMIGSIARFAIHPKKRENALVEINLAVKNQKPLYSI